MAMTGREKALVSVGVLAVAAFVAFVLVVRPAMGRVETLRRVLPERAEELAEVEAKLRELAATREALAEVQRRTRRMDALDEDFGLMAFLESVQKESGLEDRVGSVRPSTEPLGDEYVERVVDIRLEGVSLEEVARFLEKIEAADEPLRASQVSLRRDARRRETLHAIIQIRMVALAEDR